MSHTEPTGGVRSSLEPVMEPPIPSAYQIIDKLGAGAFGRVFKARQKFLGTEVALKIVTAQQIANTFSQGAHKVDPDHPTVREVLTRALAEARALASMNHPHIVQVRDAGEIGDGEAVFLAMELLDGTVEDLLFNDDLPAEAGVVQWVLEVLSGLAEAHRRGIIHRDIKPGNIGLTVDGQVKLIDFGIAHVKERSETIALKTRIGRTMGSRGFMPPEQFRDASTIDARADVYAVGALLYILLSQQSPEQLCFNVEGWEEDPESWSFLWNGVSDVLRPIVIKATRKRAEDRYQSAEAFAEALREVQGDLRVTFAPSQTIVALDPDEFNAPSLVGHELPDEGSKNKSVGMMTELAQLEDELAIKPKAGRKRMMAVAGVLAAGAAVLAALSWSSGKQATTSTTSATPSASAVVHDTSPGIGVPVVRVPREDAQVPPVSTQVDADSVAPVDAPSADAEVDVDPPDTPEVIDVPANPMPKMPKYPFITVAGDAQVVLESFDRRISLPGPVPPGAYDLVVTFSEGAPMRLKEVEVTKGSSELRCSATRQVCSLK